MGYGLGVDLGTSFTGVAIGRHGRTRIVSLSDDPISISSLVAVRPPGSLVIREVDDTVPVVLGGRPYPAVSVLAETLRSTLASVTAAEGEPPEQVVLTCPAVWGPARRQQFGEVSRRAGLTSVTVVSEPEAAVTGLVDARRLVEDDVVLVYDIGGVTVDMTIVRVTDSGMEILGLPEGADGAGGADFDDLILAHVDGLVGGALSELDLTDPVAVGVLTGVRAECVRAKETLSRNETATIRVIGLAGVVGLAEEMPPITLSQADFEGMIRKPLTATLAGVRRVLDSAGIEPLHLTAVLLVGGCSRIPLVSRMLTKSLGRPVLVDEHPQHCVALGAAAIAAGTTTVVEGAHRITPGAPPITDSIPTIAAAAAKITAAKSAAAAKSPESRAAKKAAGGKLGKKAAGNKMVAGKAAGAKSAVKGAGRGAAAGAAIAGPAGGGPVVPGSATGPVVPGSANGGPVVPGRALGGTALAGTAFGGPAFGGSAFEGSAFEGTVIAGTVVDRDAPAPGEARSTPPDTGAAPSSRSSRRSVSSKPSSSNPSSSNPSSPNPSFTPASHSSFVPPAGNPSFVPPVGNPSFVPPAIASAGARSATSLSAAEIATTFPGTTSNSVDVTTPALSRRAGGHRRPRIADWRRWVGAERYGVEMQPWRVVVVTTLAVLMIGGGTYAFAPMGSKPASDPSAQVIEPPDNPVPVAPVVTDPPSPSATPSAEPTPTATKPAATRTAAPTPTASTKRKTGSFPQAEATPITGTGTLVGLAGRCLDVFDGLADEGTPVEIFECNGSAAQTWRVSGNGTIRAVGKCLEVMNLQDAHSRLDISTCTGGDSQQWVVSDGFVANPASSQCLDVLGRSSRNRTPVIMSDCDGSPGQQWSLQTETP